ncbi:MAG TPA: hypoxanthine phosphoribosyltransferase [Bdellovibrionota bacterium]|jgi:hypoxanthine phosphoribosyltransferase|nr:hypoxanthine phosphoribosyltransferase [Bdellovibrionota bacterium]
MKTQLPSNFKILYTREQIRSMVSLMAAKIDANYPVEEELVCVGVLKGAWMFLADLVREIKRPVTIDFMRATSYGNRTQTSGTVRILKDIEVDIRGKHVLLVEEIVDSGRTLNFIKERLTGGGALSVKIASLLDKRERREVECMPDYCGAIVPNHFLVGYGLDWGESYRNLGEVYQVVDEKLY